MNADTLKIVDTQDLQLYRTIQEDLMGHYIVSHSE